MLFFSVFYSSFFQTLSNPMDSVVRHLQVFAALLKLALQLKQTMML
jgi:hypothetical protein